MNRNAQPNNLSLLKITSSSVAVNKPKYFQFDGIHPDLVLALFIYKIHQEQDIHTAVLRFRLTS